LSGAENGLPRHLHLPDPGAAHRAYARGETARINAPMPRGPLVSAGEPAHEIVHLDVLRVAPTDAPLALPACLAKEDIHVLPGLPGHAGHDFPSQGMAFTAGVLDVELDQPRRQPIGFP